MARMIPPVVHPGTESRGEAEIFRELKEDSATEDWTVLHSLDTAAHVKNLAGEVDFVVLIPGLGVLCLEVKASTHIRREYGVWYYGPSNPDYRGPFKQAAQAMHSVRNYVTKHLPGLNGVVFWSGVCFPMSDFAERSPEWHSWQLINQREIKSIGYAGALSQVLKNARRFLSEKRASWFDPETSSPTQEECRHIAQCLRPDFEVYQSPKDRRRHLNEELKRYTDEQLEKLDFAEANPRLLFTGPAGTGKTVLALEGARRASARGQEVLFVCFNKLLGQHLQDQAGDLPGVTVSTLHSYMLETADVPVSDSASFWKRELPEKAVLSLIDSDPRFDVLIVDEAQDILCEPYLDVLDASLRGGLAGGQWQVYGDFEKQHIYAQGGQGELERFRSAYSPAVGSLRVNCRNTPHIAQSARHYGRLDPPYSRILRPDNGLQVDLRYYHTEADQVEKLVRALDRLYREGLAAEDIVVLSPKGKSPCAAKVSTSPWQDRLVPYSRELSGRVGYSTIYAFKGLEASAVIITDIESVADETASRLFYVGVTRAVYRLVILAADATRDEFREILTRQLIGENP